MTLSGGAVTLSPLPTVLSQGLISVAVCGLLSFFCSLSLFVYLTYRLIYWRLTSGPKVPVNQFLFLIYNLLLADIQQALAFLLNVGALKNDGIFAGTALCWAQGWFVSTGDLASSMFILAIAIHTFFSVVREYRLPAGKFYMCIVLNWAFVYILGAVGPIIHGPEFYARAAAWCWINEAFSIERLWLHYFWLFVAMFSTIFIYILIFIHLRHLSSSSVPLPSNPHTGAGSATSLMILYPLIYTVCTAPLALGRIYALAGHSVSLAYFCVAGTMIACNGWLDVLLYASTRRDIVFSEYAPGEETGIDTFTFGRATTRFGNTTTISGGCDNLDDRKGGRLVKGRRMGKKNTATRTPSVEHLYGLHQIGVKGEVSVVVDDIPEHELRMNQPSRVESASTNRNGSGNSRVDRGAWYDDGSRKSGKSFETQS